MNDQQHILIVGAGLAGPLLAVYLARMGVRVTLCEHRSDPRDAGALGGRSINLALSARGIDALDGVGLAGRVLEHAIPMRGRIMHSPAGDLTFQRYSKNPGDAINSVSRGGLNIELLNAAQESGVAIRFSHKCVDVDPDGPAAVFEHEGRTTRIEADAVIGADGAYSAVRQWMQRTDRFTFNQEYLSHGYKELHIPPSPSPGGEFDGFAMDPNALHIWPRGGSMMIALPNADRSFTCTLFWPFDGEGGFDSIGSGESVRRHFNRWYPDAVGLMPTLVEDFERNPVSSLVTVRCYPWVKHGRIALLGDAAHAVVPFYGQGMNAAFEDCKALAGLLKAHGMDIPLALSHFQQDRKPNADAIADLAIKNFVEMRDHVGSRAFLLMKKGEKLLHALLPRWFTPLYNMISFSTIPYAQAVRRARRQSRVSLGVIGLVAIVLAALLLKVALP